RTRTKLTHSITCQHLSAQWSQQHQHQQSTQSKRSAAHPQSEWSKRTKRTERTEWTRPTVHHTVRRTAGPGPTEPTVLAAPTTLTKLTVWRNDRRNYG